MRANLFSLNAVAKCKPLSGWCKAPHLKKSQLHQIIEKHSQFDKCQIIVAIVLWHVQLYIFIKVFEMHNSKALYNGREFRIKS